MKERNMSKTNQQVSSMSSRFPTEVVDIIPTGYGKCRFRRTIIPTEYGKDVESKEEKK